MTLNYLLFVWFFLKSAAGEYRRTGGDESWDDEQYLGSKSEGDISIAELKEVKRRTDSCKQTF